MSRLLSLVSTSCLVAASVAVAGCHRAPPVAAPVAVANNDDAAARARARADSIAKADAARRDSIARANARADSLRGAEDAARAAGAARAQLLEPIHFELDRAEILASDRTLLDQKAAILTANRSLRIRIDGNADERGSDEYNLALGMRRAAQARRYLTERGIDSMRIAVASNGEEKPLCTEHQESCWSQNRRAEFVIVSGGERITAAR
jgi:peptidoglycan-associated lipoprotein